MSLARVEMIMSLNSACAMLSRVAMKRVPRYARSAPSMRAAAMWRPVDMTPDKRIVLVKNWRISGTSANRDQAVDIGFRCLACMADVDHVVKHQPAIALDRAHQFLHGAERGDDQRHLVLDRNLKVGLQPRIALVHDQVDAERRGRTSGVAFD